MTGTAADSVMNPLPECPPTPNCTRLSFFFAVPASELFDAARSGLESIHPEETREVGPFRISSVHRAGFFLDDLEFMVEGRSEGSVLHVRSASRVGGWDLGVNGRRVRRFMRAVRRTLGE